jgi:hypothetical protein
LSGIAMFPRREPMVSSPDGKQGPFVAHALDDKPPGLMKITHRKQRLRRGIGIPTFYPMQSRPLLWPSPSASGGYLSASQTCRNALAFCAGHKLALTQIETERRNPFEFAAILHDVETPVHRLLHFWMPRFKPINKSQNLSTQLTPPLIQGNFTHLPRYV